MNDDIKHFYAEPVEIEIYLKKIGKIRTIQRDMQIELIPVEPINETSRAIFNYFIKLDEPIDLMEIQNNFPELMKLIYESYYNNMDLYEKLSMQYRDGLNGSTDAWRYALYFTELMLKYEPTIASLEHLGDFNTYNLNYCIIKLNSLGEKFLLEDDTVQYLINRRNKAFGDQISDKKFDNLVKLWRHHIKSKRF